MMEITYLFWRFLNIKKWWIKNFLNNLSVNINNGDCLFNEKHLGSSLSCQNLDVIDILRNMIGSLGTRKLVYTVITTKDFFYYHLIIFFSFYTSCILSLGLDAELIYSKFKFIIWWRSHHWLVLLGWNSYAFTQNSR